MSKKSKRTSAYNFEEEESEEDDYYENNTITKTRAETNDVVFDFSFNLSKESLFELVKNSDDNCFQCHAMAKLGINNLNDLKTKLEKLHLDVRKKHDENIYNSSCSDLNEDFNSLTCAQASFDIDNENFSFDENTVSSLLNETTVLNCLNDDSSAQSLGDVSSRSENLSNSKSEISDADFDLISKNNYSFNSNIDNDFDLLV